jgi:hypothetical protein
MGKTGYALSHSFKNSSMGNLLLSETGNLGQIGKAHHPLTKSEREFVKREA